MTGTGFIKCIPITLSDLLVEPANSVIEIDDVLLAIIASGFNILSSEDSNDFLTFAFSTIAFINYFERVPQLRNRRFDLSVYRDRARTKFCC
jgi:hypothetical protein